jgi:hypothetical protein
MDGKGSVLDNICTERLWRTVKYEEVYLHDYQVTCLLAPQRMKTEPLRVSKRPLPNVWGSIFRTGE